MNTYLEHLVKAPFDKKALLYSLASLLLIPLLISGSISLAIPLLGMLAILVPFGSFYLYKLGILEYDYLYMNKELEITRIINYSRRKKDISLNLEHSRIIPLTKIGDPHLRYPQKKIKDYTSQLPHNKENMYLIEGIPSHSDTVFIFEFTPEILKVLQHDFGRNVEV